MKTFWVKFKLYAGLAVAGAIGVLYFMLGQRTKQRDKQRQRADSAERSHAAEQERNEDTRRVSQAQAEARDYNEQQRQRRNEQPEDDRRSGRLGGLDRVRDYDNRD